MRMVVLAAAALVGCTEGGALEEEVGCHQEYRITTPLPGGGAVTHVTVRAETWTELEPADVWRVSAVACEPFTSPDTGCPVGATCNPPAPIAACVNTTVGVLDTGRMYAHCGTREIVQDDEGFVLTTSSSTYLRAVFRVE